jgi:hypothetical protein
MYFILYLIFILILCIRGTVFHTTRESNAICGNNTLVFAPLPSGPFGSWTPNVLYWVSVASPPSAGRLSIASGLSLPFGDTRDETLTYTPDPDFTGTDVFALTVSRINYGVDWTLNNYAITVVHSVSVLPMPSLPSLNTSTLEVTDPDGPDIVQQYGLLIDGCGNESMYFTSSPSMFRQNVISRLCDSTSVMSVARAFVSFGDKPQLSVFCPEYSNRVAEFSVYINIPVFDWVVPNITQEVIDVTEGSTSRFTLVQGLADEYLQTVLQDADVQAWLHAAQQEQAVIMGYEVGLTAQ